MASTGDIYVYTGRWKNYSEGNVLGDKFTMTSDHALILIAFISIFDGLVGNVVWNAVCYYIHQWRASTNEPRDGLYHQFQVLLRNNPDALSFARQATWVGWKWKSRVPNGTFRGMKLSLLAIFVSSLFSAAALLSSQIASSGEVLLRNRKCGFISPPSNLNSVAGAALQNAENEQSAALAHQGLYYSQNCYSNSLSSQATAATQVYAPLGACNLYTKAALTWNVTRENPCPFSDACSVPDAEVIKLDSGLLDSLKDLGINQPQENRVLWRRVETCSPLVTAGFSNNTFYNVSEANRNNGMSEELSLAATYDYGKNLAGPWNLEYDYIHNYTFMYDYASYAAADVAYLIQTASTLFNVPEYPSFWPDARLVNGSDSLYYPISLFLLSNRVLYNNGPVHDPWFNATENFSRGNNSQEQELFISNIPGNVLACHEQAQICNPNTPNGPACTDLDDWINLINNYNYGSQQPLLSEFSRIGLNDMQSTTALNILTNLQDSAFGSMADLLGEASLQANTILQSGSQLESAALPADQWAIEMNNWFGISLATMQQLQLYQITGPTDLTLLEYLQPYPANDTMDASLCASQKVRSSAYQSFSVLGMTLNFVVGGLILVSGIFSRECMSRRNERTLRRRTWNADGALQLQRMAYERLELGEWEGEDTVPVAREGQLFRTPLVGEHKARWPTRGTAGSTEFEMEALPQLVGVPRAKTPISHEASEYSSLMGPSQE